MLRWQLNLGNNALETGTISGSDFALQNFSDTGAYIGPALTVQRSSGAVFVHANGATLPPTVVAPGAAHLFLNKAGPGSQAILDAE